MTTGADSGPNEQLTAIDHVQLAMPAGREDDAHRFYTGVLGLTEVPKPAELAVRGGCWFASADGTVAVHLGVEEDFRPARKAHPAFVVGDLDGLRESLADAGAEIVEDDTIDVRRFYTADPFGNRIEFVADTDRGFTTERGRASTFETRPSHVVTDRSGGSSSPAAAR